RPTVACSGLAGPTSRRLESRSSSASPEPEWTSRGQSPGSRTASSPGYPEAVMLLNELRGKPVTCDGEKLGLVIDLRLVIDGTPSLLQSPPRLLGVVIGRNPNAAFMGYERASVNAPALLAHYFRGRERGAFL